MLGAVSPPPQYAFMALVLRAQGQFYLYFTFNFSFKSERRGYLEAVGVYGKIILKFDLEAS